jgi:hypothetical protein
MSIKKELLKKIKCCLNDDGHFVIEPVVLKCGANACKKCVIESNITTINCFGCNKTHEKNDSFKTADNKTDDSFIHSFRRDLFEDLKNKLKSTAELLKSLF